MQEMTFADGTDFSVAMLFKQSALDNYEIRSRYLENLYSVRPEDVIAFTVEYTDKNKAPTGTVKRAITEDILPEVAAHGIKVIYCADAPYFKGLTGCKNTKHMWGYALPCSVEGYTDIQVVLGFNYQQLVYDPTLEPRLNVTVEALDNVVAGSYVAPGSDLTNGCVYPEGYDEIELALQQLHAYPKLAADIEAFSLKVTHAGLGSIGFAPSTKNAVAFAVEYDSRMNQEIELHKAAKIWDSCYGYQRENKLIADLLRNFFEEYQGKLIWHNATYDLRCIIWSLFMDHPLDYEGMLHGLEVMTRDFEDTKIIAYLATNSTAGNELGLKTLAQHFAGNYAEDVKDIRRLPKDKLLPYNCVDVMSTIYVYETYYPQMQAAGQEDLYKTLMKDSLVTIIQTELVGMPLDPKKVKVARHELEAKQARWQNQLYKTQIIRRFNGAIRYQTMESVNSKLKKKQHTIDAFDHIRFNPGSSQQCQQLLYVEMGLPVLDYTDSKQPAVGRKTLKKLMNHTTDPEQLEVLEALIGINKVAKILSAFIPAFEAAYPKADGCSYLHGNFNLGGTVSGRLSSNDPNLQQIPSGSEDAKLIKDAFVAPPGWVFCGADFNSLEDYISALTTKDPNKLKVYQEGFDGHSLRAHSYWPEKFPFDEITPELSVMVKKDAVLDKIRSASKGPTFALTYQGTWKTLVTNLGFSEADAKRIEAAYHELYQVSDKWVQDRLDEAARVGYVVGAFGLKVRTPLLARTLRNHRSTPYEAQAEGRTAGNALGQSYGLLTNRALNEFMKRVKASKYRLHIMPVAMIHDAIYLLVRNDHLILEWVNTNLIECMQWQELPEIQHDTVKLGAELDIFWPSWAHPVTLSNNWTADEIYDACSKHYAHLVQEGYLEAA